MWTLTSPPRVQIPDSKLLSYNNIFDGVYHTETLLLVELELSLQYNLPHWPRISQSLDCVCTASGAWTREKVFHARLSYK